MNISNSLCSGESECLPCLSQHAVSCVRDTPSRASDRHLRLMYAMQRCVQVLGTARLESDICFTQQWKNRDSKRPQRPSSSKLFTELSWVEKRQVPPTPPGEPSAGFPPRKTRASFTRSCTQESLQGYEATVLAQFLSCRADTRPWEQKEEIREA